MVPEPTDTGHSLLHGVVVQAPLAQHRARRDRAGIVIFDGQNRRRRIATVFREEAIIHCSLGRCV
eukprot:9620125-Alexandrium_andersonii.AAC.1